MAHAPRRPPVHYAASRMPYAPEEPATHPSAMPDSVPKESGVDLTIPQIGVRTLLSVPLPNGPADTGIACDVVVTGTARPRY